MIEAITITKQYDVEVFEEWLSYNLARGFDRISIYDNESEVNIKDICDKYPKVSYTKIEGIPRQYLIYDEHFKKSNADWILPLDDDEYLWFTGFNNIKEVVDCYKEAYPDLGMLAIRWKHLFPKIFHSERKGYVLDYCTEENSVLASLFPRGDNCIKTLVRNDGTVHYQETWENPNRGHVPNHSKYPCAITVNGEPVKYNICKKFIEDEPVRILHCRYTGYSDYLKKISSQYTISDSEHILKKDKYKFNKILELLK